MTFLRPFFTFRHTADIAGLDDEERKIASLRSEHTQLLEEFAAKRRTEENVLREAMAEKKRHERSAPHVQPPKEMNVARRPACLSRTAATWSSVPFPAAAEQPDHVPLAQSDAVSGATIPLSSNRAKA